MIKTQFSVSSEQVRNSVSPLCQVISYVTSFHRYITHYMVGFIILLLHMRKRGWPQVIGISWDPMAQKWQGQDSNLFFKAELLILTLHYIALHTHSSLSRLPWTGEMLPGLQTHCTAAEHSEADPVQPVMGADTFHRLLGAARDLNLLLSSSLSLGKAINSTKPPQMHCPKRVTYIVSFKTTRGGFQSVGGS